jgi:hypothetical protein
MDQPCSVEATAKAPNVESCSDLSCFFRSSCLWIHHTGSVWERSHLHALQGHRNGSILYGHAEPHRGRIAESVSYANPIWYLDIIIIHFIGYHCQEWRFWPFCRALCCALQGGPWSAKYDLKGCDDDKTLEVRRLDSPILPQISTG